MPEVIPAVGDLSYQWYKAPEGRAINEFVEITSWPTGSRFAYGEDYIRICPPNDQNAYSLQNVGEGGNANTYYGDIRFYYPEGAVKFKEANWNPTSSTPDMNTQPFCMIIDEHPGVDVETGKKYILDWVPFAYYTPSAKLWTPYGWNKPLGEFAKMFYRLQWFDEADNLLRDDFIEYQYASEETFNATGNFELIEGANSDFIVAAEPGIYKLEITRTRNRAETKGESIEYRVTNAPAVPVYADGIYDKFKKVSIDSLINDEQDLMIAWNNDIQSDEFYVTWFLDRSEKKLADLEVITYKVTNEFESHFDPTDYKAVLDAAKEDVEGWYYALVKNKLNGVISNYSVKPDSDKMFNVTGS